MSKTAEAYVLPKVPSQLIRIALEDLEKAEASEAYRIDMHQWHLPNGQCAVCLAGAVMSFRLNAPLHTRLGPGDFYDNVGQLCALDDFRKGDTETGFAELGLRFSEGAPAAREIAFYEDDPAAFKADMRKLADELEAAGY